MNDRFKFRIWWKKENRFRVDTHIIPIGHLTDFANSDEFVVEQCTGLKDKNGNLIYENDQFYDSNKRLCTVSWFNGAFHNGFGNLLGNFRTDEIEIIGNVHELAEQKG